jgi:hypothetical protein
LNRPAARTSFTPLAALGQTALYLSVAANRNAGAFTQMKQHVRNGGPPPPS